MQMCLTSESGGEETNLSTNVAAIVIGEKNWQEMSKSPFFDTASENSTSFSRTENDGRCMVVQRKISHSWEH